MNKDIKYLLVENSSMDGLIWVKGFKNKDDTQRYMVKEYDSEIESLNIEDTDIEVYMYDNCQMDLDYAHVYHEKSMEDVFWEIVNVDDIEMVVNEVE